MLEYSGTLFHGMRQMGLHDMFDALKRASCDPAFTVAASNGFSCPVGARGGAVDAGAGLPPARRRLAAPLAGIFGVEALQRVRGFSPSEMALPITGTSPTSSSEALRRTTATPGCWCRSTASSGGKRPRAEEHLPHRYVCTNSEGGPPKSSRSSRRRAPTPSWSRRCRTALLRGEEPVALGAVRQERAAAGHADRRRREQRRDDERVPVEVYGRGAQAPARRRR